MSNRKEPLVTGEYYHIYNRGVDKRKIFAKVEDVGRFMDSIAIFNQIKPTNSVRNQRSLINKRSGVTPTDVQRLKKSDLLVSIVAYCVLPNHFHFLLKQKVDGGISEFMKRLLGGYTKYFNDSENRSGSLFQGKFKSKNVSNDRYLRLIFPYISYNFLAHGFKDSNSGFIKTSVGEYKSNKFDFIDKAESHFMMDIFEDIHNLEKNAYEIISEVRKLRGKSELNLEELSLEW